MTWLSGRAVGLGLCSLAAAAGLGCRRPPRPPARLILISIDTLRADHLGAYGYARGTSPFFDSLAARGTLFENAVAQLPGTLPSHMSIFTGLYPAEHAVYPPEAVLSPRIRTLPEVFGTRGFRTAGHSEGGYVAGRYGFARGFEEWSDPSPLVREGGALVKSTEAVRATFRRGLDFLRRIGPSASFFLFLHTYSVHDPYEPPPAYRSLYWSGPPPPGAFPPTGSELSAFNAGTRTVAPGAVEYYRALYDAQIKYTDDVLADFFASLGDLNLADATVIVTSDHGEEFLEHGKLVHEQVYHESLHVPLLVVRAGQGPARRVRALVQSIDIAPTLFELAGIPVAERPRVSGRSLVPLLEGDEGGGTREAYAEAFVSRDRALYRQTGESLFQLVRREPLVGDAGLWISRSLVFESPSPHVEFWAASYHRPRELRISVDGKPLRSERLDTAGRAFRFDLPAGNSPRRVELASPTCSSPARVGEGEDPRCLSFRIKGVPLARWELYDLRGDPRSARDISRGHGELSRQLAARLQEHRFSPVAAPGQQALDPEQEERLRALGYLH